MPVKTARERRAQNFYECVLHESEKNSIQIAREVEGIDEEVALLRLRLRTEIEKAKTNFPLLLRGLDALRRLIEVKYRLGEDQSQALGAELALLREELLRMYREEVAHDGDPGNR